LLEFVDNGFSALGIERQVASNLVIAMIKKAWLSFCREKGFVEHHYSNAVGFHASAAQAAIGQRIPWGKQGDRRPRCFAMSRRDISGSSALPRCPISGRSGI
jgi:hypothetical protein